jgi:hypothetical protein
VAEETEEKVERPKSLAEQIKEGAKSAGKAPMSYDDLDGASKACFRWALKSPRTCCGR